MGLGLGPYFSPKTSGEEMQALRSDVERSGTRFAAIRRYGKAQIVAQERALRAEGGLCCTHPPDEHTILRSRSQAQGSSGNHAVGRGFDMSISAFYLLFLKNESTPSTTPRAIFSW